MSSSVKALALVLAMKKVERELAEHVPWCAHYERLRALHDALFDLVDAELGRQLLEAVTR